MNVLINMRKLNEGEEAILDRFLIRMPLITVRAMRKVDIC